MRFSRSGSMDQRPNSAKSNLGSLGRRSTINTEDKSEKRISYDETRMKRNLETSEVMAGNRTSSLPRGTKIGNSISMESSVKSSPEQLRKKDGNGMRCCDVCSINACLLVCSWYMG